jgi:hypothetical protein
VDIIARDQYYLCIAGKSLTLALCANIVVITHLDIFLVQIVKIGMVERVLDRDAILGIVRQEKFE